MTNKKENKLTAKERIEALEKHVALLGESQQHMQLSLGKQFEAVVEQFKRLELGIKSLNKKINATITAGTSEGGINNDSVTKIMVAEEVEKLKANIKLLKDNGVIVDSETGLIGENSFVVGRELDEEKKEINPRIQFHLGSLADQETIKNLVGKKVGDLVHPKEGSGDFYLEITEVYDLSEIQNVNPDEEVVEDLETEAQQTE